MAGKTGSDIGERVADVDEGDTGSQINEQGLTAEEQAQFDAMRSGQSDEGDGAAGGDDGGGDGEDDDFAEVVDDGDDTASAAGDRETARDGTGVDGEVIQPKDQPKTISYGKYLRELQSAREKTKKATAEAQKEREERLRLDERTKLLLDAINARPAAAQTVPEKEPEDLEPDAENDPFGHGQWTRRELARTQKQLKDLAEKFEGGERRTAVATEADGIMKQFDADLEHEARTDPVFEDAFLYLRDSRYRELGAIYAGIDIMDQEQVNTLTPKEQLDLSQKIQNSWSQEQLLAARNAASGGRRPAAVVRALAKARGFDADAAAAARAAKANGTQTPAPAANGTRPSPAARPAAKRPNVREEIENIRSGVEGSRSLSDGTGAAGMGLTMDALNNMSEEEFADLYATVSGQKKVAALLGKN